MIRKFAVPTFLLLLLAITIPLFHLINSQSATISGKKVAYELPYPGILPDHPLYFLKKLRDRVMDLTTRDDIKKAELYVNFSDKDVNTAIFLVKKGKENLATDYLVEGEKYGQKIPGVLKRSKQQGVSPSAQFIDRIKESNIKHRQVIQDLMKDISQSDQKSVENALRLNDQIRREIESF